MFVPVRLITELHFVAHQLSAANPFRAGKVVSSLSPDVTNDCQRRPIGRSG
jgi:hypothetical protein